MYRGVYRYAAAALAALTCASAAPAAASWEQRVSKNAVTKTEDVSLFQAVASDSGFYELKASCVPRGRGDIHLVIAVSAFQRSGEGRPYPTQKIVRAVGRSGLRVTIVTFQYRIDDNEPSTVERDVGRLSYSNEVGLEFLLFSILVDGERRHFRAAPLQMKELAIANLFPDESFVADITFPRAFQEHCRRLAAR